MTNAKEQNPLSDLNKDLLQGRPLSSERMIKILFMIRPLIFLTQHYTTCFKKAMKRMKRRMINQLGMNRQERWVREKSFEKQTTKYGIAKIFII